MIIILAGVSYPLVFQEGNPIPLFIGIAELTSTEQEIVKIAGETERYITQEGTYHASNMNNGSSFELLYNGDWDGDIIKDGVRYNASWTIYLGNFRVYELGQQVPAN